MYCQIRFGILYCSAVFLIVISISVSNISPRIIMKRKATAVETKPPFTSVKEILKISPETRISNFN